MKILSVFFVSFLLACASNSANDTQDPGRWRPYSGCGESQCRSWNSACEVDCMNQSKRKQIVDAEVCTTQCREKMNECTSSCSARPGA